MGDDLCGDQSGDVEYDFLFGMHTDGTGGD